MNSEKAGEAATTPAAAAEAISGDVHTIKLAKGRYYSIPWGNPSVGTPWVAELTGLDTKYGLARRFIRAAVIERRESLYLIDVKDMKAGAFYEVKNPSSWRHPDMRFYFQIINIDLTKGELVIKYIERKDLIMYFREHNYPVGGHGA